MIICPECQKEFPDLKEFNGHPYKDHKITIEKFCRKYWPKNDLFTKEPLDFKNSEFYLNSFFNDKINLRKYCAASSIADQKKLFIDILLKCKEKLNEENCNLAPDQVYLRSIVSPSIVTIEKVFEDSFCDLVTSLGFDKRFNYKTQELLDEFDVDNDFNILVDTREQSPLILPCKTISTKIDFGDYAISGDRFDNLFIERKSLNDLCGTLSQGYERFERELSRAKSMGANIIVLVEEQFSHVQIFNKFKHMRNVKAKPEFIQHQMRSLIRDFDNIRFLFADGRGKAANLLIKILKNSKYYKDKDLQYLLDKKCI